MKLTPKRLCALITGREYRYELSSGEELTAAEDGLVIIQGASDDLVEIRGAIDDEVGCYEGGTLLFKNGGLLKNSCPGGDDCPYFEFLVSSAKSVKINWDKGEWPWSYETDIPHETFEVFEDGLPYCLGIVFRVEDIR